MDFRRCAPGSITNNFGVDPNYRLGYVQIWNVDVQQQIRPTLIMNLDYTGTKGTRLDILEAPNRTATGVLFPGVQPFYWEDSVGDSTANALSVRVRKRLQAGLSIGGRYTFSKSLDNASTIGSGEPLVAQGAGRTALSGTTNVAQDAFDLAAERGLSSFDQRHSFTADYLWELPFGHDRRWLAGNSPLRAIFGDWNWSGDWTIASGLPFTPRILGDPVGCEPRHQRHSAGGRGAGPVGHGARSVDRASGSTRPRSLRPRARSAMPAATASRARAAGCSTWHSPRSFP